MKSSTARPNQPNKGSKTLKEILEKKGIENIPEDLIGKAIEIPSPTATSNPKMMILGAGVIRQSKARTQLNEAIDVFNSLIAKELSKAATGLGIDETELQAWVNLQIEVPAKTILTLLRMMQNLSLDPLCEEIAFTQYEDGQWQVLITIEGCAKLLNQHPQFNGLVFTQADTLIDGVPEWIECAIYRKDRSVPTTVREYLAEVRGENAIWQKMPRRMLRHRALQQCVRLAIA